MTVDNLPGFEHRPSPSNAERKGRVRVLGTEANARLTSSTALVLLVLLAIEGLTVLQVRSLLTLHVPPILVKLSSTIWRFAKYYAGSREYREKGPPPVVLRLLGPFISLLTIILFGSGILLLLGPLAWRGTMLTLHQASFVVWFAFMTVHVLCHIKETVDLSTKDWIARTKVKVAGSRWRRLAITTSLVSGVVLGIVTMPAVGPWLSAR
jgi:hypothetical protein